ncbi:hypothetical protein DFH06DRAFT_1123888 [Mycena polygramma]|nr:hypothetical protein DFH06DRAFT_1123888 [Mycena polygramma]
MSASTCCCTVYLSLDRNMLACVRNLKKAIVYIHWTRNQESLREAAHMRMQGLRSTRGATSDGVRAAHAKYRDKHRAKIRDADRVRRAKLYIEAHGAEAFDEKQDRHYMKVTQKRHEGRVPERARAPQRVNRKEVLTDNQKRCRALRTMGFEEDNGQDLDEDLGEGMGGCERTKCQRAHKNETQDRRNWKAFHIKYANELEGPL